jgi:hypothetical protein
MAMSGKSLGGHNGSFLLRSDLFQPSRQIDARSDAGKVQPVSAANVAVENFTQMQS